MDNKKKLWRGMTDHDLSSTEADFVFLGLPFDKGCSYRKGTCHGPDKLRETSDHHTPISEDGTLLNAKLVDLGNVDFKKDIETQQNYFTKVQTEAEALFKEGFSKKKNRFPIFLGGDHSITIPLLRALDKVYSPLNKNIAVIHLDAHLDLCDELDGNPLSHGSTHRRALDLDNFNLQDLYFIGIRSYEKQELDFLKNKDTNIITSKEIYKKGIEEVSDMIIKKLAKYDAIYLTVDIDVLDLSYAPGTGTPVAGGLSTREVLVLLERISYLSIVGMDLVEVSPPYDHADITTYAAHAIIFEMISYCTKDTRL